MELRLAPETRKLIEDRVNSGEFANAEEVVSIAVKKLCDDEADEFAPGEMDALLAEAERSGPPVPYESARLRFAAMRAAFIAEKK